MSDVDLPIGVVRDHLTSALHLIVQVERATGGGRRVVSIRSCVSVKDPWLVRDGALTPVGSACRDRFGDGR